MPSSSDVVNKDGEMGGSNDPAGTTGEGGTGDASDGGVTTPSVLVEDWAATC